MKKFFKSFQLGRRTKILYGVAGLVIVAGFAFIGVMSNNLKSEAAVKTRNAAKTTTANFTPTVTVTPITIQMNLNAGWHIISMPIEPSDGDPAVVFDEISPTELKGSLHRYDPSISNYLTWNPGYQDFGGPLKAGEGYWLYLFKNYQINITGTVSSAPTYGLTGVAGSWNIFGPPLDNDYPLNWVKVKNGSEKKTWEDAATSGWIQRTINVYNQEINNYDTISTTSPANGYWLTKYLGYWTNFKIAGLYLEYNDVLTAQAVSDTQINLSWPKVEGSTTFEIQRSTNADSGFTTIASPAVGSTSYSDTGLTADTTYYYKIRALSTGLASSWAKVVSAKTAGGAIPMGTAMDVVTDGSYAYVASTEYGLVIVDISNPAQAKAVGSVAVGFKPTRVSKEGNLAVLVGGRFGYAVVDVSNPISPIKKGSATNRSMSVVQKGNYAYIIDDLVGYLRVVDLSNSSSPVIVANLQIGGTPLEIAINGDYVYTANSTSLKIINIGTPLSPVVAGTLNGPFQRVAAIPGYAFVDGLSYGGIQVVDTSDLNNLSIVGQHQTGCILARYKVSGNRLYAAFQEFWSSRSGLRVIDISNPPTPSTVAALVTDGGAFGVAAQNDIGYLADTNNGLVVINTLALPMTILTTVK